MPTSFSVNVLSPSNILGVSHQQSNEKVKGIVRSKDGCRRAEGSVFGSWKADPDSVVHDASFAHQGVLAMGLRAGGFYESLGTIRLTSIPNDSSARQTDCALCKWSRGRWD